MPPGAVANCTHHVFSEDQIAFRLYVNMPITILGVLTNFLNVAVFCHRDMRQSLVNWFLLALSVSDLFLLLCNFFFLSFPVMAELSHSLFLKGNYALFVRHSYPLGLIAQTSGVYLTVLVSVHRFFGVCHPFKAQRWVTQMPVKIAILGAIVFAITLNISRWFELSVVPCYSGQYSSTMFAIQLTHLQNNYGYFLGYKVLTYTLVMFIVPFCILIVVNTLIVNALRRSKDLRGRHGSSRRRANGAHNQVVNGSPSPTPRTPIEMRMLKYSALFRSVSRMSIRSFRSPSNSMKGPGGARDRSVTMMLLAIVAMFLICNSLAFCNNIVEIIFTYDPELWALYETLFDKFVEIGNILVSLNSSTTIFIYLNFSTKYRLIVKRWLGLVERRNEIAITTALAARKALQLSALPGEVRIPRSPNKAVRLVSPSASESRINLTDTDGSSSTR